ncbi:ABC transporter permease [Niabella sp. CC-SYL272]|uniref:ABC transporter permease n=1 Tax=Niabella agricola TaxID=2891571 RepID=UPI001F1C1B8D|nr:FtsX-like permease family protein [Niabella agricola]MCF3108714.1 ABC transporter permease [Niabella agricola]
MKLKLLISIAGSLLLARRRQTLVAAIGVTFSITMFIALLGFMTGLNDLLDGLVLNRTPHVRLYKELQAAERQPVAIAPEYSKGYNIVRSVKLKSDLLALRNSGNIIRALEADERVTGIAPKIVTQAFYNAGLTDLTGMISGIDVVEENRLFRFSDYIIAGSYIDLKNVPNSIIIGKGIADNMLTGTGDIIQLTTPKGDRFQLKVVGIFESGLAEIDKVQSYVSITTAQKMVNEPGNYLTDIQVQLKDLKQAPAVAREFASLFGVQAMDIQAANAQFETGSFIRTLISYAVGITLLIVAGFGIYNILNMMIYEKMDSIAILKATGFSGSDVQRVFLIIALSIGFFGGLLGLLFGWALSALIDQVPFVTPSLPTINTYPVSYSIHFYLIAGFFSVITTYFAGFFPARKASRVDPVIIIRGK